MVHVEPNKRLADHQRLGAQLVGEYGKGASLATLTGSHTFAGRVCRRSS